MTLSIVGRDEYMVEELHVNTSTRKMADRDFPATAEKLLKYLPPGEQWSFVMLEEEPLFKRTLVWSQYG